MLKTAARVTLPASVKLVNLSITEAKFHDRWKFQVVVTHHKKGDKFSVGNYYPVCHLIEMGKLVELVVWDQLLSHCVKHGLIHPHHHGSMPHHDRVTALSHLQDTVSKAAEGKNLAAVIMLDQTASYDMVDHGILLQNMLAYNFHPHTVAWFASYLGADVSLSRWSQV